MVQDRVAGGDDAARSPRVNAEREIWRASPHELVEVAEETIKRHCGADRAEIFLADYRAAYLQPLAPGRNPIPLAGNPASRAFATLEPVLDPPATDDPEARWRVHLPLTVLGNRLGVLIVGLAYAPPEALQADLSELAATLSRALEIADRATDRYRRARRRSRLTLAAEMQWELLPGRTCSAPEYEFAGQLEPAYAVAGDNFDWTATGGELVISVTNGMGWGTSAALLTQLAVGALRNARRSGADLTEQAGLADETVHRHFGGERHVATVLLSFDLATGAVTAVDAGSPKIYRLRDGQVDLVELERQLPLGMFGDTVYTEQQFKVESGDRLLIVSDGVHAAHLPGAQEEYGPASLPRALRATRMQPPGDAVRTILHEFLDGHGTTELADDAVVVCLDWKGR